MSGVVDLDALPPVAQTAVATPAEWETLVAAARPAVVRGLVAAWPAVAAARRSPDTLSGYLQAMDRGQPVPVMEASAASGGRFGYTADLREFSFARRQRGLTETLNRIGRQAGRADAPVTAIQMLPLTTGLPRFVAENFLPLLPGVDPMLWLGGPVRTQIHNDRDHNLACVIAGRRRFVLFPPDQVANLYLGPPDNPPALSLVDPEQPDLDRFPRFRAALAVASVAELGPGDALFMPRHWWHHVTSRDPYNAMVNYWWGRRAPGLENPHDAFLTGLLALKDLPPSERGYWHAMFEAFVFAPDDAAVAHLPPDLRGPLGTMRPAARASLKQKLKAAVMKSS